MMHIIIIHIRIRYRDRRECRERCVVNTAARCEVSVCRITRPEQDVFFLCYHNKQPEQILLSDFRQAFPYDRLTPEDVYRHASASAAIQTDK